MIWPSSHGAFDLLAVRVDPPHGAYLHTALALPHVDPLITMPGQHELDYAVLAKEYPVLRFTVTVTLTGDLHATEVVLQDSDTLT